VAWIRRVRTASGAVAVQIAEYDGGRRKIVAHVGSARTEAGLGILLERAREMPAGPAQGAFDLGIETVTSGPGQGEVATRTVVLPRLSPDECDPAQGVTQESGPATLVTAPV
jgi:hypothetical protein